MRAMEATSQDAIIELAQACPHQPCADSTGLNSFQQVQLSP